MTEANEQIPSAEERRHPRRQYLQAVTIHVDGRTCRGMIQNMSTGGVYVEGAESLSVGQEIAISYPSSNNRDRIETQGKVVRTDETGFAMEYT